MEPFNIKIGYGANEVTLTILPAADEGCYKVIYFGGIVGAIRTGVDCWELIPEEELIAGELPFYKHDLNSGRINVVLNESTVDEIGEEIDLLLRNTED